MAASPSSKTKPGQRLLLPFYCGITKGKTLKNVDYQHTHYVLIAEKVASRLGIKKTSIVKPGSADAIVNGIVFQKNRKKSTGDKKAVEAKRYLTQCKHKITAYCKATVANKAGDRVQETYSIGFPSGVPLRLIIKFFKDNAPNVVRIGTGGNLYMVR
jgi:hypothetical protein